MNKKNYKAIGFLLVFLTLYFISSIGIVSAATPKLTVSNITETSATINITGLDTSVSTYQVSVRDLNINVGVNIDKSIIFNKTLVVNSNGTETIKVNNLSSKGSYLAELSIKDFSVTKDGAFKILSYYNFETITTSIITSFTPEEGKVGDTITINGEGFKSVDGVFFGSVDVGLNFKVITENKITAIVPKGAIQSKIIVKTTQNGNATSLKDLNVINNSNIKISASKITPTSVSIVFSAEDKTKTTPPYIVYLVNEENEYEADISSNQYKTINSDNISSMGMATVVFNDLKPNTKYNVKLEHKDVSITEINFTTLVAPITAKITDFSPKSGKVGTEVTITGVGLILKDHKVYFGDKSAIPSLTTPNIVVKVPTGATTGPIAIDLNPTGTVRTSEDFVVLSDSNNNNTTTTTTGSGNVNSVSTKSGGIEFSGLVPKCNTGTVNEKGDFDNPCDFGFFMALINKVIQFLLFVIATPLVALIIMYTGYLYITAGGNAGQTEKVRHILFNVVIGYVIALAAWLIVNTIITSLKVDPEINTFMDRLKK